MCPETEKGVLAALLPSGGLSALAGVSRAPLQWSQRLSPFICDNLDPHWFSWESPAFKNHGCGCLIADQLRLSGKGILASERPMRRFPWTDRRNHSGIWAPAPVSLLCTSVWGGIPRVLGTRGQIWYSRKVEYDPTYPEWALTEPWGWEDGAARRLRPELGIGLRGFRCGPALLALGPWVSHVASLSLSACRAGADLTDSRGMCTKLYKWELRSRHIVAKNKPSVRVNSQYFPHAPQYHHSAEG